MRKIIHIFLSLVIVYATTTSVYANTSTGGWTALDTITAGATNTINATKTAGGKVLNSAVTVGASANKVGKYLIKGAGGVALAFAMVELLDEGIDWVLDPANNSVIYTVENTGNIEIGNDPSVQYLWSYVQGNAKYAIYSTPEPAAVRRCSLTSYPIYSHIKSVNSDFYWAYCKNSAGKEEYYGVTRHPNPVYDPSAPTTEQKSIPIDTVAAQVISNADAGHAESQEVVKAVALEGFAAGDHDTALEAAAVESDVGTENPTDPNNPAEPVDPAVPFDPSSIIAAISALKAMLAGILSSITSLSDFFQSDPPPEKSQTETDVPVEVPPQIKNASEFDVDYMSFSSQCPVLPSFSVGIGSVSSSMSFDMSPLCDLAVTIRPAIIAIAYFIGLGVVASAIRET